MAPKQCQDIFFRLFYGSGPISPLQCDQVRFCHVHGTDIVLVEHMCDNRHTKCKSIVSTGCVARKATHRHQSTMSAAFRMSSIIISQIEITDFSTPPQIYRRCAAAGHSYSPMHMPCTCVRSPFDGRFCFVDQCTIRFFVAIAWTTRTFGLFGDGGTRTHKTTPINTRNTPRYCQNGKLYTTIIL